MFRAMVFPLHDCHPMFERWLCISHPHQDGKKRKGDHQPSPFQERSMSPEVLTPTLCRLVPTYFQSAFEVQSLIPKESWKKISFPRLFSERRQLRKRLPTTVAQSTHKTCHRFCLLCLPHVRTYLMEFIPMFAPYYLLPANTSKLVPRESEACIKFIVAMVVTTMVSPLESLSTVTDGDLN